MAPKNGVWSEALVAEKIHEQSLRTILFGTHRPGRPDDTLMPPGISLQFKGYGWDQDESRLMLVWREPRMYRIPEDPKFSLRTTWLRITTGWEQFEDRIPWAQQVPRTPKFQVWGGQGSVRVRASVQNQTQRTSQGYPSSDSVPWS